MQVTVNNNNGVIAEKMECGDVIISAEGVRKVGNADCSVNVEQRQFGFMMRSGHTQEEIDRAMDDIELCHFIHPSVTDNKEKMQIHREIENLVRSTTIPNICSYLSKMAGDSRILLPIEPTSALKELRRMGMPGEDIEGFKYKNFAKYYRR